VVVASYPASGLACIDGNTLKKVSSPPKRISGVAFRLATDGNLEKNFLRP
jgi:hypothetical protein